jgi:alpha-ketoglutarate-dependent taurine dioxygenase
MKEPAERSVVNPSRIDRLKKRELQPVASSSDVVKFSKPFANQKVTMIEPIDKNVDLFSWLESNTAKVESHLLVSGGLLFRDFPISSTADFEKFLSSLKVPRLEYKQRSSPRHQVGNFVYTSTDHPKDQFINMHNEHSYSHEWPLKISFFCQQPSATGGETPIADSRDVLAKLSKKTRMKFEEKKVLYERNIGGVIGMGWREVFQTDDRAEVVKYCEQYDVKYQWSENEILNLKFIRPAIRRHPKTNEEVWFNHAFFFNILSLEKDLKESLLLEGSTSILPFLTYYGDGSEIEPHVIEEIRSIYRETSLFFPWKKGDVLLLDNMLMAHGRNSFTGDRTVLVGMLEAFNMNSYRSKK